VAARAAFRHRSGQRQRRSYRAGTRGGRHRRAVAGHIGRRTRTPRGRPRPGDDVLRRGAWDRNLDPTGTDVIDCGEYVTAGAGVWWGQAAAEPRPLVDMLIEQSEGIGPFGGVR